MLWGVKENDFPVLGVRQWAYLACLLVPACQWFTVILLVSVKKVNGFNLHHIHEVGSDVLTSVVMKSSTLWYILVIS